MKFRSGLLAMLLTLAFSQAAQASTIDIIGGETRVKLTSLNLFASLGLDLGLVGSATISGSSVTFPITGGSVDMNGFAMVEHDGSGIRLSGNSTKVALQNFFIETGIGMLSETGMGMLSGDVFVNGAFVANLALFNIASNNALILKDGAAVALSNAFGINIPGGVEIGIADVQPQLVPIPGAAILMFSGLAGLVGLRRRKR